MIEVFSINSNKNSQRKKEKENNTRQFQIKCTQSSVLKANSQRPVFSLGVSRHNMHTITNLWTFGLNRSSILQKNNERKNTLVALLFVFSDAWLKAWVRIDLFLKNYVTFETSKYNSEVSKTTLLLRGNRSHIVLYYQQLPIAR